MAIQDTGHGAAVAFGTSTFINARTKIKPSGYSLPEVRLPHLGLADGVNTPGMAGDIATPDPVEVEVYRDPSISPPRRVTETITLTYPIPSGLTNGATETFSATIVKVSQGELMSNDVMKQTLTLAVLGTITLVVAS